MNHMNFSQKVDDIAEGVQRRQWQAPHSSSNSVTSRKKHSGSRLAKLPSVGQLSVDVPSAAESTHPFEKPKYFESRRISDLTTIQKPWMHMCRDPREKWQTIIPMLGLLMGLGFAGLLVWTGYRSVSMNLYCEVISDDFTSGLNPEVWIKEVEVGGYG